MITLVKRRIAVKPIVDPDKTQGGNKLSAKELAYLKEQGIEANENSSLTIPDVAKERTDQGIVKYVGPAVKDVQVGDYILFSGYTGSTVQFAEDSDGTLIIFDERFVICKLNNPDTDVRGLYFRGIVDAEEDCKLNDDIVEIVTRFKDNAEAARYEIRKLFAKHESNKYFGATYEMAMNLIAESFRNSDFAKGTGFKDPLSLRKFEPDFDDDEDDINES